MDGEEEGADKSDDEGPAPTMSGPAASADPHLVRLYRLALRVLLAFLAIEIFFVIGDLYFEFFRNTDHRNIRCLFNMAREDSIPTWFASGQALLIGLTLFAVAYFQRLREARRAVFVGWLLAASFFVFISMDDAATFQALLHVQDAELLLRLWSDARASAMMRRPLLQISTIHDSDALDAWIRLKRLIWETVNQERYRPYQAAWKEFYRRWRSDDAFEWPTVEPIREQHERLVEAALRFELVPDPLGVEGRERLYERALERVLVRGDSDMARVARVRPPIEEILP